MIQKYLTKTLLTGLLLLVATLGYAQDIKNYNDCEVCPGQIHYGAEEARKILGQKVFDMLRRNLRTTDKIVKIDLNGVLKNGSEKVPDSDYEVKISSFSSFIYIKSLVDHSFVQLIPDDFNAQKITSAPSEWYPEIFMQAAQSDRVHLAETTEIAWQKFRDSHIYQWITDGKADADFAAALSGKITYALECVAKKAP
ncbi:hypothetical protein [Desulfonema ishimotonii]|uniref:hypothetical protein n=1 Tax=Desulfonema ishimotonii TaxID=45657 RepID=UPI000F55E226|nr:hypothetical protein [Desulfonema ishimotonii]